MADSKYAGGCFCGDIRYEATGAVTNLCFCHCTSCRRAAGVPAVPWGTFVLANFKIVKGTISSYRSSPGVARGFCARCGTSLTYHHGARAEEIDVTLASLDDPTILKPERHIWMQDELPWVVVNDGLPQFVTTAS